jgi:hypothetical protein
MTTYRYEFCGDLDSLEAVDRNTALSLLTLEIPSVLKMSEFLLVHPDRLLSSATEVMDHNK